MERRLALRRREDSSRLLSMVTLEGFPSGWRIFKTAIFCALSALQALVMNKKLMSSLSFLSFQ